MPSSIEAAPDWLVDLCRSAQGRPQATPDRNPLVDLDTPEAIARAVHWLAHEAPSAVEGAGGDGATYRVAARLRELGVSEPVAVDLIAEHWNETKASPPWPLEDLARKVENAYAYATGGWGAASAAAEFEPVDIAPAPKPRPRLYRLTFDEAADNALTQSAEPLVEDLLDQKAMGVVYGDSNSGKTFVMLDIAFHIASGRPWQGRAVAGGTVVYVAAEGGHGITKRIRALRQHYGTGGVPLDLVPCPVNLRDPKADTRALIDLVAEAGKAHGQPVRMVVIDTLSRALAGGDENASTDMGAFVANVDRIRAALGVTLIVVHHSGKDAARGARGWSGLRAATDTEIEIVDRTIRVSKQRDLEPARDTKFALDVVQLGTDARGRRVTSCVLRVLTGNEFMAIELTGEAEEMWEAFQMRAKQQVLDRGLPLAAWENEPVTLAEWEKEYVSALAERNCYPIENIEEPAACPHPRFKAPSARHLRRLRTSVVDSGHVKKVSENQWVKS